MAARGVRIAIAVIATWLVIWALIAAALSSSTRGFLIVLGMLAVAGLLAAGVRVIAYRKPQ